MADRRERESNELMSQRVFQRLESEILERVRPPGSRLVEDGIAVEFGVSRTPVREALRMLHRAGWIDMHPHAGAYVRQASLDEVRDVFDVRRVLERESASRAAVRATPADIALLRDVLARGDAARERGDIKGMLQLNREFHQTIAVASGNELLRRFLEELDKQVRWHFSAVVSARARASWAEHDEIVAAIEARDHVRAADLSAEHCRRTQDAFIERFVASGPQSAPSLTH
jgi:DNA-binding GntR family transcriptional regulator